MSGDESDGRRPRRTRRGQPRSPVDGRDTAPCICRCHAMMLWSRRGGGRPDAMASLALTHGNTGTRESGRGPCLPRRTGPLDTLARRHHVISPRAVRAFRSLHSFIHRCARPASRRLLRPYCAYLYIYASTKQRLIRNATLLLLFLSDRISTQHVF